MSRRFRRLRRLLGGAFLGALIGSAVVVVAPAAVGWRTMTVMSGSMSPAIATGDAVVIRPVAAAGLRPGDVATFRDPAGTARLITHRVLSVQVTDTKVHVTTLGDANNTSESWDVAVDGRVGRVVYRVPRIGYVIVPASAPLGRLLLVGLPVVLLGIMMLAGIWRHSPSPEVASPMLALPAAPRLLALPPGPRLLALPPGRSGHAP